MPGDLHTHTVFSDGGEPIEKLPPLAAFGGMDWLAVTDHDTFLSCDYAQAHPQENGVRLIPGVELTAFDEERRRKVHFLCYYPDHTPELTAFFAQMAATRNENLRRSCGELLRLYPFLREEEITRQARASGVLFKAYAMRTLLEYGFCRELYGELYQRLFGVGGPCATHTAYHSVHEVLALAHAARGVVVLAHPSVYKTMELARELASAGEIDGVEINHPGNTGADKIALKNLAMEYGLLMTGGTDYHALNEDRVCPPGTFFTSDGQIERLVGLARERHRA